LHAKKAQKVNHRLVAEEGEKEKERGRKRKRKRGERDSPATSSKFSHLIPESDS